VTSLVFTPLTDGVSCRAEVLYRLGFAPFIRPAIDTIRSRYRSLTIIYHPDSNYGNNERMIQLNAAMDILGI
jgi:hypothetical protein